MISKIKKIILFLVVLFPMIVFSQTTTLSLLGNGTQENPYQLSTSTDLVTLSNWVNDGNKCTGQYFILTNDINMKGISFNPIGKDNSTYFSGYIDGQYHKISNLTVNGTTYVGLFGYIDISNWNLPYPYIKNLGITNSIFTGTSYVGSIVGYCRLSSMKECYSTNCNISGGWNIWNLFIYGGTSIGGLIGEINNVSSNTEVITQCYTNNDSISGVNYIGGIVGHSHVNISYCYSTSILNQINYSAWNMEHTQPISVADGGIISNCFYLDDWSYDNQAASYYQYHFINTLHTVQGTHQSKEQLKNTTQYLISHDTQFTYDNFNQNNGYPILKGEIAHRTITIIGNAIVKTNDTINYPDTVIIPENTTIINQTNSKINAIIKNKLYVNRWNLWGLSQITNKNVNLLNYNKGLGGTIHPNVEHDIVASDFDYNTNNWYNTYLYRTDLIEVGKGYFIYPLDINYDITSQTYPNGDDILGDSIILLSQKGILYNDDNNNINIINNGNTNGGGRWVVLSNPYTANIDIKKFLDSNNVQGNLVYLYDAKNGHWVTNIDNITKITKITISQGFIIACLGNQTTQKIKFSKNMLIGNDNINKSTTSNNMIIDVCANNKHMRCYMNQNNLSSDNFDENDGYFMVSNNNDLVQPYFVVDNNRILLNSFKDLPYICPINFYTEHQLVPKLKVYNIPENIKVSLIDIADKSEYCLNDTSYTFVADIGNNDNRFYIKIEYADIDIIDKNDINIYPNPANDFVNIYTTNSYNSPIKIIDIQGRIIKTINQNNIITKIDIQDLNSGIYFVKIDNKIKKLIISK